MSSADTVIAATRPMLDWALKLADRECRATDEAIPFSHAAYAPPAAAVSAARDRLGKAGLDLTDGRSRVLYCGGLTRTVDLVGLAAAAYELNTSNPDIQIVIFGAGDRQEELHRLVSGLHSTFCADWAGIPEIAAVAECSAAGLVPYIPTFDFEMGMPNKVAEYLYFGLPIITSLRVGPVAELINNNSAGCFYEVTNGGQLAAAIRSEVEHWHARRQKPLTHLIAVGARKFGIHATRHRLIQAIEQLTDRV